mgnify:CR=1 FL=1
MRKITRRSFLAAAAACGAAAALTACGGSLHLLQLLLPLRLHPPLLLLLQPMARSSRSASASWCSMPLWMPLRRALRML